MMLRYDLSRPPDHRFLQFWERFTTREPLLRLHDELIALDPARFRRPQESFDTGDGLEWWPNRRERPAVRQAAERLRLQREFGAGIRELLLHGPGLGDAGRKATGVAPGSATHGFRKADAYLKDLYWAVGTAAALTGRGTQDTVRELCRAFESLGSRLGKNGDPPRDVRNVLERLRDDLRNPLWSVEAGFLLLAEARPEIAGVLEGGFETPTHLFHWGLARVAHQLELNRTVEPAPPIRFRQPRTRKFWELRETADGALRHGRWERAVETLTASLSEWEDDYLGHYDLGRALWFRYGWWEEALYHFGQAAQYAGEEGASGRQKYLCVISRVHCGMLWRLYADSLQNANEREDANRNAYRETLEALRRYPNFLMARVEHVANCARIRDPERQEEALGTMETDARWDPARLLAYALHTDVQRQGALVEHLDRLREWAARTEVARTEAERVRQERERVAAEPAKSRAGTFAAAAPARAGRTNGGRTAAEAEAESTAEKMRSRQLEPWLGQPPHLQTLRGAPASYPCLAFSPDGRLLAVTEGHDTITIRSVPGGGRVAAVRLPVAPRCFRFSRDSAWLAVGLVSGVVQLLSAGDWELRDTLTFGDTPVLALDFPRSDPSVVVCNSAGNATLWEPGARHEPRLLTRSWRRMTPAAMATSGSWLALPSGQNHIELWDMTSERLVHEQTPSGQGLRAAFLQSICLAGDGAYFATTAWDTQWYGYDHRYYSTLRIIPTEAAPSLDWSRRGREYTKIGRAESSFSTPGVAALTTEGLVTAWAPDGRGVVHIHATRSQEHLRDLFDIQSAVVALAFSPTEPRLAALETDGTLRLWSVSPGIEAER